jgi:hypothetical protein
MSKYKAIPTYVDNIRFPSKLEARYYSKLKLRQQANDIKYFLTQVPFRLPGGIKYVCDFMVVENDGSIKYIDTKGIETATFKLKKKQVEALFPVKIEVVKKA